MGETSLDGLLRASHNHLMREVHTAFPGKIESFNETTRLATVKPMVSRRYFGSDSATELPVIQEVPIVEPRTQKGIFALPITTGDPVLVICAERAIDNWLASTGAVPSEPLDVRMHNLTDAFAILGGWPTAKPSVANAVSGAATIKVAPGTKISIGNGILELIDVVSQMLNLLATDSGNQGGPLANSSDYLALKTQLDEQLKV